MVRIWLGFSPTKLHAHCKVAGVRKHVSYSPFPFALTLAILLERA